MLLLKSKLPTNTFVRTSHAYYSAHVLGEYLLKEYPNFLPVLVCGSGTLASVIPLYLHRKAFLVTNDKLIELPRGPRFNDENKIIFDKDTVIAIIDDSAVLAREINRAAILTKQYFPTNKIIKCALYATDQAEGLDVTVFQLNLPHFFEWNFPNSVFTPKTMYDFDGVLCEDPPENIDQDELKFTLWAATAKPRINWLPNKNPIHITTGRLDKYKEVTKQWLKKYGITALSLNMWPNNSISERDQGIIQFKANNVVKYKTLYMVESNPYQATILANMLPEHYIICSTDYTVRYKGLLVQPTVPPIQAFQT